MSIELKIDLGERFGRLIIRHEKSLPKLLEDLSVDRDRIRMTIKKPDFSNSVKEAKGMLPKRILILNECTDLAEARLAGYKLITRELYVGEDGTLIEEVTKRPLKHGTINLQGIGITNLEDTTIQVNPRFLPEWLTQPRNEAELRRSIKSLFYSSSS